MLRVLTAALLCLLLQSPSFAQDPTSPPTKQYPNIIVFLTDDQGWGDLSVNGNRNLATPNIDSLARDGATLENFYVCQVCAPTRAELLTGRYYPRTGVSGVSQGEGRLNPDERTLADIFKAAGYATGCFGKWHNGTQPPYHPNDRGFDEFYGFTSGHWGHYFSPPLDHNGRRVRGKGYIVDDTTDHALKFIEEHRDSPFLCYLPYNTPHSPMMISDEYYSKFADAQFEQLHRDPEREDLLMTRAALAMCENIDWNVGRVLRKVDDLKLRRNTIVIYFSDNGPNSYRWNGGMKGRKGAIDEGGLRSPFFIRWPDHITAGARLPQISGAIDLLPTLTELAGVTCTPTRLKPIDGRSLVPLLHGEQKGWPDRALFAVKGRQVSVRTQRFRLDASGMLFDIESDRGQHSDVSKDHLALTARLSRLAAQHGRQMQSAFEQFANRPFTVGYGPVTTLTARDGVPHGTIERSSKAPNNSFFTNWTQSDDSVTWNIDVGASGEYSAILYYTCRKGDTGATMKLATTDTNGVEAIVRLAFDPPLYDKSMERVEKSHYFVKDFKPLELGTIRLTKGKCVLTLSAPNLVGGRAVDVHSIDLIKK